MSGRGSDGTTRPKPFGLVDDSYGYRVSEEGLQALAEYEERHGKPVLVEVSKAETATGAPTVTRTAMRRQRRKRARQRGHRLVTVCGKWRGGRKIPDLRLIGLWLERAGFDLGRQCEIEVTAGTLTIRAV